MHQHLGYADKEGVVLGDGERVDDCFPGMLTHAHDRHGVTLPSCRAQPVARSQLSCLDPTRARLTRSPIDPEGVIGLHPDRAAVAQLDGDHGRHGTHDDRLDRPVVRCRRMGRARGQAQHGRIHARPASVSPKSRYSTSFSSTVRCVLKVQSRSNQQISSM